MTIIHTVYTAKQCVHIDIDSVDMVYENRLLLRVGNNAISMIPSDENFCFQSGSVGQKAPWKSNEPLKKFHFCVNNDN